MGSYILYYLIFVAVSYGVVAHADRLRVKRKALASNFFYFVGALFYSFDSYFRGDRGTDTLGYREHFEWIQEFSSLNEIPEGMYQFELGYNFVTLVLGGIGVDFEWFKFFVAAFGYIALSKIADFFSILRSRLFLFTTLAGFLFFSYNGVRQWIALLLFYLGLAAYQQRKYFWVASTPWIALLFHKSSIVPILISLVVGFVQKLNISRLLSILIVGFALIFGLLVAKTLNLLDVVGYAGSDVAGAASVSGSIGFGWPLQVLINSLALYIIFKANKKIGVLEVFVVAWYFIYIFMAYNKDVMRLAVYFSFAQSICLAKRFLSDRSSLGIHFLLIFLLLIQFVSLIYFNAGGIVYGRT